MAWREAQLAGRGIPAETGLHPFIPIAKYGRAGIVPCAKQPGQRDRFRPTVSLNGDALCVEAVARPAALGESLSRESFAIIGFERERVASFSLLRDDARVARRATERYCCSENKSCCVASSLADSRLTAAKAFAASALRPRLW